MTHPMAAAVAEAKAAAGRACAAALASLGVAAIVAVAGPASGQPATASTIMLRSGALQPGGGETKAPPLPFVYRDAPSRRNGVAFPIAERVTIFALRGREKPPNAWSPTHGDGPGGQWRAPRAANLGVVVKW